MKDKPRIAVTMGDPSGIGPEICVRLLNEIESLKEFTPIIFGDSEIMKLAAQKIGLGLPENIIKFNDWGKNKEPIKGPSILDIQSMNIKILKEGGISKEAGKASWDYLDKAIKTVMDGNMDALTTGPINKDALHRAGYNYPGHTEILAEKTGTPRYCMMQNSKEITATFVTCHLGLREACSSITTERIIDVINLTADALNDLQCPESKKILVCGLNPHSGEGGLFGSNEEEKIIKPAIEAAISNGIDVTGPIVPDTAFIPEKRKTTGAYVCMYHDQGHIPLKALAFDNAVNITLGLPIIRTSVDHGTAFDIAWKGIANHSSLLRATQIATDLVNRKNYGSEVV
ncbi:4-hydroxythreonine-4-phosphate dehydrogenase PdxA [Verrucomicrobia bacterium]|nr:4-hydroxythreonine-4-phosphate dehydrogenase PdxA [Verrucomicrobiota bacterium]|tara:strand:+ start:2724 stop:3752 length:1029 start_codon:yes stop_codon:yes gene_type:complete